MLTAASDFLKQLSSCFCIDLFIKLLTDYEQLSYYQFNRNLSICVSLAKD